MSGKILVLDPVATHRIVLKVKLLGAGYDVLPCARVCDALDLLKTQRPDLIVVDMNDGTDEMFEFCAAVKLGPDTAGLPILTIGNFTGRATRLACLEAGADDAMNKPLSDTLLFARIRSLLRMNSTETTVSPGTERALGFAEGSERFTRRGKVTVFTPVPIRARALVQSLQSGDRFDVRCVAPADAFTPFLSPPDVIVIDARTQCDTDSEGHALRLVSECRSRADLRSAEQLIIVPEDGSAIASLALDLGASDVVSADAPHEEIMIRLGKLHFRKTKLDRMRDTVRTGLEAAVRDTLTGLYNRRYAEPHIKAMSETAFESGTPFAILALDVDHFKCINDRYGHGVGDQVLATIAGVLRDNTRSVDLAARFGGEEFVVAMPDTSQQEANIAAERIRDAISKTQVYVELAGGPISVTVSVGVALCEASARGQIHIDALMERADAALYRSKSAGRNTVSISPSV